VAVLGRGIAFRFKNAFAQKAALNRGDLTDAEWRILRPLPLDWRKRKPLATMRPAADEEHAIDHIIA